jgi:hypothetical protein
MYRAIVHSCWGGCGNHLRWLLLLDPGFLLFDRGPIADKVDYILSNVYPAERNCKNWFRYEFKYRQVLNEQIKFAHTDFSPGWENRPGQFDSDKNYFLYPKDPTLTLDLYKKFVHVNTSSYRNTVQYERQQVDLYLATQPGLLLDPADLYTEDLDKMLHSKLCQFGNFAIDFDDANKVHKSWYHAHQRLTGPSTLPAPLCWPYVLTTVT